jgi:hypothetical protein
MWIHLPMNMIPMNARMGIIDLMHIVIQIVIVYGVIVVKLFGRLFRMLYVVVLIKIFRVNPFTPLNI